MLTRICADLKDQQLEVDHLVSGLEVPAWQTLTPFYGWTIMDQVAHIAFFDHEALLAIEAPDRFKPRAREIMDVLSAGKSLKAHTNALLGIDEPGALLDFWRRCRSQLLARLGQMDGKQRLTWYGPDMGCASFATARLMETWAHGQDIFDALGKQRNPGPCLYHIAHLAVAAFAWSFKVKKRAVPEVRPWVRLEGPGGEIWEWGDPNSPEGIRGPAQAFCLVTTQRRHVLDTALEWEGKIAGQWLEIAQAFAGVSQEGPAPGERIMAFEKNTQNQS